MTSIDIRMLFFLKRKDKKYLMVFQFYDSVRASFWLKEITSEVILDTSKVKDAQTRGCLWATCSLLLQDTRIQGR